MSTSINGEWQAYLSKFIRMRILHFSNVSGKKMRQELALCWGELCCFDINFSYYNSGAAKLREELLSRGCSPEAVFDIFPTSGKNYDAHKEFLDKVFGD